MESSAVDGLQDLPPYLVGLDAPAEKVKELLEGNARVAIVGVGGVGKTTVARKVFNDVCRAYEYTCFYELVKDNVGREALKLASPAKQLKSGILRHLRRQGRRVNRHDGSWEILKGKKVLLVLDDVDSSSQVLELDEFSPDSKLIVTARSEQCLNGFAVHEVESLDDECSHDLFCYHAFKERRNAVQFEEVFCNKVDVVVSKCDGLPLTLEVLGNCLRDTEDGAWEETLDELDRAETLECSPEARIRAKFRAGVECLPAVEREMFWDVAVFHDMFGRNEDVVGSSSTLTLRELKWYWSAAHEERAAETGWRRLLDRRLVRECLPPHSFDGPSFFETRDVEAFPVMHEHLRDVGRVMASPPEEDFESHSRIAISTRIRDRADETLAFLRHRQGDCKAKALVLEVREMVSYPDRLHDAIHWLETKFFARFPRLQLLVLRGLSVTGQALDFPSGLSVLRLKRCYYHANEHSSPATQLQLTKLVALQIQCPGGGQEILGHLSVEALPNLRIVDADVSPTPGRIVRPLRPGEGDRRREAEAVGLRQLGTLPALEELSLEGWRETQQLPTSLGQLKSLRRLRLHAMPLESLPSLAGLARLEELYIRLPKLGGLPESLAELPRLEVLVIEVEGQLQLPQSMGGLCALRFLEIRELKFGVGGHGDHWPLCERLPDSIWRTPALEHLSLESSFGSRRLAEQFGACHLRRLFLTGSLILGNDALPLPLRLDELASLEELGLYNHLQLELLPPDLGRLRALRKLHIGNCGRVAALPVDFGELQNLRELEILHCAALLDLPASFGDLQNLRELEIRNCFGLLDLPESFGELRSLQRLVISGCSGLKKLPETFGQLCALQTLEVNNCKELTELPSKFGLLSALEHWDLRHCRELRRLPKSVVRLSSLQTLFTVGCPVVETFKRISPMATVSPSGWAWTRALGPLGSLVESTGDEWGDSDDPYFSYHTVTYEESPVGESPDGDGLDRFSWPENRAKMGLKPPVDDPGYVKNFFENL